MARNRGVTGRFVEGHSGNPNGRPKGIAALVKAETRDGAELVAFALRVLRAEKQPTALRLQALQWLADRGFGKAVSLVEADISVDAQVTQRALVRLHLEEADVDRFTRALLGADEG